MRLSEVFKALEEGKKIASVEWDGYHYIHMVNMKIVDQRGLPFNYISVWHHWEIYEEKQFYTYFECIPFLKEGKKIRRYNWNEDLFVYLMDDKLVGNFHMISQFESFELRDWEILD